MLRTWTSWWSAVNEIASEVADQRSDADWDWVLLVDVLVLVGFGLVMLYSASAVMASETFGDHLYLVREQAMKTGLGLVAMVAAAHLDYRWYQRWVYWILGGTFLLLLLVFVPGIGEAQNGARRWIGLGIVSFQPAEVAKVTSVMFLAYSVAKKGTDKMSKFLFAFIPHALVIGGMIVCLLMQPDFGTSVILVSMMGGMLFVSGAKLRYLFGFATLGLAGGYFAIISSPYRMDRILAFMNPWEYQNDIGYQVVESLIAIGSGGLWGKGLGSGAGKLGYVPELWNDYIGTVVAEELGFVGMAALVAMFGVFLWRGFHIALQARDRFGRYLAFGLTLLIGGQAAANLCVVTGLLPPKGLTLPFVSYGGTSMMVALGATGILLNISRQRRDWWEDNRRRRIRMAEKRRIEKRRSRR
jgi:cell division protein FtsW